MAAPCLQCCCCHPSLTCAVGCSCLLLPLLPVDLLFFEHFSLVASSFKQLSLAAGLRLKPIKPTPAMWLLPSPPASRCLCFVLLLLAVAITIATDDCHCHHHWHPTHGCYWHCCFSCQQFVISEAITGLLSSFLDFSYCCYHQKGFVVFADPCPHHGCCHCHHHCYCCCHQLLTCCCCSSNFIYGYIGVQIVNEIGT